MGDVYSPSPGLVVANPLQNIIEGVIQGAQLHAHLQRARDEHDAMQRQAVQQQRENSIQDIQQRMLMQGNSREVRNGVVTEEGQPIDNGQFGSTPVSLTRKADRGRTISYKDQGGQTIERELFTPEEQMAKQVRNAQAMSQVGKVPVDFSKNTMGSMLGIGGTQYLNPNELPAMFTSATENQQVPLSSDQQAATGLTSPTVPARYMGSVISGTARVKTNASTQAGEDQRKKDEIAAADKRNKDSIASRESVAARRRNGELTANAQEVKNRFNERQQQADQTNVDKQQQQEQALHGQRNALGDAMKANDGDIIPNPLSPGSKVTVNPAYRSLWKNKIDEAAKKIGGLQASQKRLVDKWKGDATGPPAETPPAEQPAAAAPAIPDAAKKALKEGTITTFKNGQKWTLKNGQAQQVQAQGQ